MACFNGETVFTVSPLSLMKYPTESRRVPETHYHIGHTRAGGCPESTIRLDSRLRGNDKTEASCGE
jgi:hypothetical protein